MFLQRVIKTTLEFEQLSSHLRGLIGIRCKLGSIEIDRIHLYYHKNMFNIDRVPACELLIKKTNNKSITRIQFRLALYYILFGYFWPILFTIIFIYFDIIASAYPFIIASLIIVTLALMITLKHQSDYFENELKVLEKKTLPNNGEHEEPL